MKRMRKNKKLKLNKIRRSLILKMMSKKRKKRKKGKIKIFRIKKMKSRSKYKLLLKK